MKLIQKTGVILLIAFIAGCSANGNKIIQVENKLPIDRDFETIELSKEILGVDSLQNIAIKDLTDGSVKVSQLVDNNGDGKMDLLLFQVNIKANSKLKFEITSFDKNSIPESTDFCYSRFVPERIDDYTWENNRVAFRVYGPTAQKMVEQNIPGGTLSSGVDAWLKRVEYPIINKWYKETIEGTGSYHKDTGEGLDNFHVGVSRGVGGIAIESDENYYYSKNYTDWRTITTGPVRTSFYLKYADWDANGNLITESRIISLDYGSNLSKFEIFLKGSKSISVGLTMHEKNGVVASNPKYGWTNYYEPLEDSEISTAIVASPNTYISSKTYDVDQKDLSNVYTKIKVVDDKAVYYSGFFWKKSKQFKNNAEWENYLNGFAARLASPLVISVY